MLATFRGNLSVKHSNDDNDSKFKTLYVTPTSPRIIFSEANKVTSIPSKNTKQVVNKISEIYDNMQVVKQAAKRLTLLMTSQNGDSKVMNIYDIKSVRYNGVQLLKIVASFGELTATGQFANKAIKDLYSEHNLNFEIIPIYFLFRDDLLFNETLYKSLPADIKAKKRLIIATDPTDPPFQYYDAKKNLIGAEIDLVRAVGKVLGVEIEFVTCNFQDIIPGVQAGLFDASVSAFASTIARQKYVNFVTYFNTYRAYLYRKGTLPNIKNEGDLCGLKVGIPEGTTMATTIMELSTNCTTAGKPAIAYSLYPDQETTVDAVRSGCVDLTVLSAHVSSWWQNNEKQTFEVRVRRNEGKDYNGIVVRKGSLTAVMQKAIQQLMDDGTLRTIFRMWNIENLMRSSATINTSTR
jgi:polar amino acid transport system substrate-binding protein